LALASTAQGQTSILCLRGLGALPSAAGSVAQCVEEPLACRATIATFCYGHHGITIIVIAILLLSLIIFLMITIIINIIITIAITITKTIYIHIIRIQK